MGVHGISTRDKREIEIIAMGLPVKHGIPLACDNALVSPLHANGQPHTRAARRDGEVIKYAGNKKERTCPELVHSTRCQLLQVGGRWSDTCAWIVE